MPGAPTRRDPRTHSSPGALRPGYGLLIAAGTSLALWAGLVKLAMVVLR